MKNMLFYINQQHEVLSSIIQNYSRIQLRDQKQIENIIIYATGSSINAVYGAAPFMQQVLNIPVIIKEPSIALEEKLPPRENDVHIAVSQGGYSASTIELVKLFNQSNHSIYTLTSDINSPISQISHYVIDLMMGVEEMPYVTLGHSATILVLWLTALKLGILTRRIDQPTLKSYLKTLQEMVEEIPKIIKLSQKWIDKHMNSFDESKRFVFIGYGACYGVAREAETKITETVHLPTHGYELEAYMHGPYLGLHEDDCLILLDSNGVSSQRMKTLREFLDLHMKKTYAIHLSRESSQKQDLVLGVDLPEELSSILMIIPIHMMSYYLSQLKGIDLTTSLYPEFDQITGSKILKENNTSC